MYVLLVGYHFREMTRSLEINLVCFVAQNQASYYLTCFVKLFLQSGHWHSYPRSSSNVSHEQSCRDGWVCVLSPHCSPPSSVRRNVYCYFAPWDIAQIWLVGLCWDPAALTVLEVTHRCRRVSTATISPEGDKEDRVWRCRAALAYIKTYILKVSINN